MGGKIDTGKAAKMSRKLVSLLSFSSISEKRRCWHLKIKNRQKVKNMLDNKSPCNDILSSVCSLSLQSTHQNPVAA